MFKGLSIFRQHFVGLEGQYILIGGAACDMLMSRVAYPFRATRDMDIVLCVEALTPEFGRRFWDFIRQGGYQAQERADGTRRFYRFRRPTSSGYPDMLELFSKRPDAFMDTPLEHLTPIPLPDAVSSLSAILLDDDYYSLMLANRVVQEGVSLLSPEALIVLKAKAWMDLLERRAYGEHVDSRDVKKHRNDVLRLCALLVPGHRIELPGMVAHDMKEFLHRLAISGGELRQLGLRGNPAEFIGLLEGLFG
jgi:hypothetical protein